MLTFARHPRVFSRRLWPSSSIGAMRDARQVLILRSLCTAFRRARARKAAVLRDLYRRLSREKQRAEHARIVRIRHYLTRSCLLDPEHSVWTRIWDRGSDQNLITYTGLSRHSFTLLLERFSLYYNLVSYNPKGGRPRKLRYHHQVLGLLLAFYVGSMGHASLCGDFGVPHSTLSRVINEAERALARALAGFAPARIVWPTLKRQRALARLTAAREPLLPFTWGFIDGKNLRVTEPPNSEVQNAHYNGWLHAVYVTGTLCFSADGLIVWSKHNCPGSWNDADTSLQFRELLRDPVLNPDPRLGIIADSAFPCGGDMVGRIMTPLKEGDLRRLVPSVRPAATLMSGAITSVRQAIEWGMGSVENVFHHLLLPLPYDSDKRKMRLDNLFRLANYRVRTLEVSQIRTTFMYHRHDNA